MVKTTSRTCAYLWFIETAYYQTAPRHVATGRLKVPVLYPPPSVGHKLQPRSDQVQHVVGGWLTNDKYIL
jgi:hypothetical protein